MDSLLQGFPIGEIVLWETDASVAHREFLGDFNSGDVAKLLPEERNGEHKFLVYDGQQRLQTLYTVLGYSFNGKTLWFDLLFDRNNSDSDDTGFFFKSPDVQPAPCAVSMVELAACDGTVKRKVDFQEIFKGRASSAEEYLRILGNFEQLWSVFVSDVKTPIACFSAQSQTTAEVNEIFRRLNIGGIALTQLELVLSSIK